MWVRALAFFSSVGAFTAVLTARSHSPSDESWDHPEAAGTQLWSNREHQQLSQPVRAAAHQRQVEFFLYFLPVPLDDEGYFLLSSSGLIAPLLSCPLPHYGFFSHFPLSYPLYLLLNFNFASVSASSPSLLAVIFFFHRRGETQSRFNPSLFSSEVTVPNKMQPLSSAFNDTLLWTVEGYSSGAA